MAPSSSQDIPSKDVPSGSVALKAGSSPRKRRRRERLTAAESLHKLAEIAQEQDNLARRLTYLMAVRVLLITLVLGTTTLLYWLGDADLTQPNSLILYSVIGSTYVLTLVYARFLRKTTNLERLAWIQIVGDLAIASVIVHVTGGAQSAYTFFYPLAVIGSAVVHYRRGAILLSLGAAFLFVFVSILGWSSLLPTPAGQHLLPSDMSNLALGRALALNLAAIAGVGAMAIQLADQLQQSSAYLAEHRLVAADLLTLHEDIVRCLTSGLITVNEYGRILTINETASEILQCDPNDVIGEALQNYSRQLASLLNEYPIEQEARRGEVLHSSSGREITLGVSISPLFNHKSEAVGRIINFQDLTEVREMERQIQRAERLTVIGTLAAGVAHEIRNPLASISGSIELLGSTPSTDEDSAALMTIVTREIERLDSLISELLDYANPRAPRLMRFDLCEVIRETLRVFAQNSKFSRVRVEFSGDDGERSLDLVADPEKVRQLIWNLLRNGAEASLQGGRNLWVSLEPVEAEEQVLLVFQDDGPGIPDEFLDKVFDPFFTTKAKGSGLGLATVHSAVLEHRGTIEVTSEEQKGARFEVRLPYDTGYAHK